MVVSETDSIPLKEDSGYRLEPSAASSSLPIVASPRKYRYFSAIRKYKDKKKGPAGPLSCISIYQASVVDINPTNSVASCLTKTKAESAGTVAAALSARGPILSSVLG